ncbi:hypothetical protein B566_EDAN013849 [Ephemera danica]|nr:hypothetical protein B566_EDAN013849 [Ephemera danica]
MHVSVMRAAHLGVKGSRVQVTGSLVCDCSTTMALLLKLVVLAVLVALCFAQDETTTTGVPPTTTPLVARQQQTDEDYDSHPQYVYSYSVSDLLTGDHKHQEESRDGDVVRGSYSLLQPDGTRRVVHYAADDLNGFNAVITNEAVPTVLSKLTTTTVPATKRHHVVYHA